MIGQPDRTRLPTSVSTAMRWLSKVSDATSSSGSSQTGVWSGSDSIEGSNTTSMVRKCHNLLTGGFPIRLLWYCRARQNVVEEDTR